MNIKILREKQIEELCLSLLEDYRQVLSSEEIKTVYKVGKEFRETISIEEAQELLLPIVKKVWDIDLASGEYHVVSWNKYADKKSDGPIVFATISKKDNYITFCGATEGVSYEIDYDHLIGACYKDGATLFEDASRVNPYTVGIMDGKAINSYNGATKFITPAQLVSENREIDYPSKHNELILDARYIKRKEDVYKR